MAGGAAGWFAADTAGNGGGVTTAFPFFAKDAPDFKMAFRKRILHKGSAIGYHRQNVDEVYYVISGTGDYTLNGKLSRSDPAPRCSRGPVTHMAFARLATQIWS